MPTPILDIPDFTEGQDNPDANINRARNILEAAFGGKVTVDMGADAAYTLKDTGTEPYEWKHFYIVVTNTVTMTAARNVLLPTEASDLAKIFLIENNTGDTFAINFGRSGGTTVAVEDGTRDLILFDGTDAVKLHDNI